MSLTVERVAFGPPVGGGYLEYEDGWRLQRLTHAEVVEGNRPDTVLLLEHAPVFTAGKRTNSWERPTDGTPVIDVDRGGRITWHGPGQIVGYPIVRLPEPFDVIAYVRRLERMLLEVCADFAVPATTVEGRSGVWVEADAHGPQRKLGAIGVRVARGVTMHGFALNVDNSLEPYDTIVACGIRDAGTTTLGIERRRRGLDAVGIADVLPVLEYVIPTVFAKQTAGQTGNQVPLTHDALVAAR